MFHFKISWTYTLQKNIWFQDCKNLLISQITFLTSQSNIKWDSAFLTSGKQKVRIQKKKKKKIYSIFQFTTDSKKQNLYLWMEYPLIYNKEK